MGTTTISVPDELADELYDRKGRGESYADVIYRLIEQADAGDGQDGARAVPQGAGAAAGVTTGADAEPDHGRATDADEGEGGKAPIVAGVDLGTVDVPGSEEKAASRREAVGAAFEYIIEHGEATPADLREDVYPGREVGYVSGRDPGRSWWKNCVYPALKEIAEREGEDRLKKGDHTGRWSWHGE